MRKTVFCTAAALLLACASCSENHIYPVSGKVMYQNAPAAGATVFFYRENGDPANEQMIMGIVQEDGTFELVCGASGKGAPAGNYDVVIVWKPRNQGRPQRAPDKLNGRYADRQRPLLHAIIKAERNELAPFELTD